MLGMTFGPKLQMLMKRKGLTRSVVSNAIGAQSDNTVTNYIAGKTTPDLEKAIKLARLLDVSLDYLADDEQDDPPQEQTGVVLDEREAEILRIAKLLGHERALGRLLGMPVVGDFGPLK